MLIETELFVIQKGLNYCPSVKRPNKEKILDNIYFYRLKEHFYKENTNVPPSPDSKEAERCEVEVHFVIHITIPTTLLRHNLKNTYPSSKKK